jgi:hypothetical protein
MDVQSAQQRGRAVERPTAGYSPRNRAATASPSARAASHGKEQCCRESDSASIRLYGVCMVLASVQTIFKLAAACVRYFTVGFLMFRHCQWLPDSASLIGLQLMARLVPLKCWG